MQYKVQTLEISTTNTGKRKMNCELTNEMGDVIKATIWEDFPNFQGITFGSMIEGDLVPAKDPKYRPSLSAPKQNRAITRNFTPKKDISESVNTALETKARNIAQAQDRSAWMWAKNNASDLVANHPAFKFLDKAQLIKEIEEIATKIYNAEPLAPF